MGKETKIEKLSPLEESVLLTLSVLIRRRGEYREDEYHMISSVVDLSDFGRHLDYELRDWKEVDPKYKSDYGSVPYSDCLHEAIERLVERRYFVRDEQNPILIRFPIKPEDKELDEIKPEDRKAG